MGELEIFSIRIKLLREQLGMTQKEFAAYIKVTQQSLSGYERSVMKPPIDVISFIAKKCGISIDWLCGLTELQNANGKISTYSDVIRMLLKLESCGIEYLKISSDIVWSEKGELKDYHGRIDFYDTNLAHFFSDWKGMKELHDKATVDDDLYKLWVNQQLEKYNRPLVSADDQIYDIQLMEEEHRHS